MRDDCSKCRAERFLNRGLWLAVALTISGIVWFGIGRISAENTHTRALRYANSTEFDDLQQANVLSAQAKTQAERGVTLFAGLSSVAAVVCLGAWVAYAMMLKRQNPEASVRVAYRTSERQRYCAEHMARQ